ncbi:MAG: hypothetical protein EA376_01215 [Phycisphaeraceae bacterium]|nr:MAG: hypothetical protein EA376_01215 [Phycisphaeraceae bacterium]
MAIQGMFAVLRYKVGGFDSVGSWVDLTNVRDVTVSAEANEADVTTRGNQGWRQTIAGLREATIEFEMVWEPGDDGFDAIKDAFLTSGIIGLAALDSPGAQGNGPVGDWSITNFSRSEPLEEGITVSVTAKLAEFDQWTENGVS